jgi:NADH-quinone oxidoreductase subunit K
MLVVFIITVAACEAAIAMALVMLLAQRSGKLDSAWWQDLREATQPAYVDQAIPEERIEDQVWPHLTPAGIEPERNLDEELHRPRV